MIDRSEAREILFRLHLAVDTDFRLLRSDQVERVLAEADRYGYRKPRNANGSRARYFLAYVQRRATQDLRDSTLRFLEGEQPRVQDAQVVRGAWGLWSYSYRLGNKLVFGPARKTKQEAWKDLADHLAERGLQAPLDRTHA